MKTKETDTNSKFDKLKSMVKEHKLFSVMICMAVLSVGLISAYYVFGYETEVVYTINGTTADLVITSALTDQFIDVGEGMTYVEKELIIQNNNGHVPMGFNITTNVTSFDPLCDATNDLNVTFWNGTTQMIAGQNFTMQSGINNFILNASLDPDKAGRACPSNVTISIAFSELI